MDNDEYILGIDLGTTYTCVGVMRNDKIEIIPNQLGNRLTPSWVSFTEKETLIGYAAKNKSISNLKNTIYCVKRIIGRNFSDPIVQNDIKLFPFKVIKNSKTNKPLIQIENKNEKKDYYPEQISSMILKHVKKYSEEFLGKKVNKAVISVPAYFNESQKKATKVAGEIAGLNVIRIINEPTAGAIAYGYGINNKLNDEKKNILVFDLGGGTYDISILKLEKNKFTVLSINGDTHLGGEDFDNKLLDFCVEHFKKETGINIKNHKNSEKALRRLKNACEKAKIELSGVKSTDIDIDSLIDGIDCNIQINRTDLEYSCHTLFEKLIPPIKEALKDAKLNKENIDDIILVGGSSRIPKIQEMLMEFFNKKNLNKTVNLDEIVAEGAAMQAYILKGNLNLNIININPISLGISCEENGIKKVMSIIIPKNTQLPCKLSNIYENKENQKNACFPVYQGENKMALDNYYLDSFMIYGLRPAPEGEIKFDVKMELDENGILKVSAKEIGGSHYEEIEIEGVNDLTKEQIEFFKKQE